MSSALSNPATIQKRLVLGCGALAHDMVALLKQDKGFEQLIDIHCLPANLHHKPQLIAGAVDKYLAQHADQYADVLVAYGDCGTSGELDKVLQNYNARRIAGEHCFEFFTGKNEYQELVDQELGSFFLTDFLVKFFDSFVVEGLGLDRYPELFDAYFKHYTKMIYVAQTKDSKLQKMAKAQAQSFGLEYEYRHVGIKGIRSLIENLPLQDSLFGKIEINYQAIDHAHNSTQTRLT
jgi:hypothetical protein